MNIANKNPKYESNNTLNLKYKVVLKMQSAINEYKSDCFWTEDHEKLVI